MKGICSAINEKRICSIKQIWNYWVKRKMSFVYLKLFVNIWLHYQVMAFSVLAIKTFKRNKLYRKINTEVLLWHPIQMQNWLTANVVLEDRIQINGLLWIMYLLKLVLSCSQIAGLWFFSFVTHIAGTTFCIESLVMSNFGLSKTCIFHCWYSYLKFPIW